MINLNEDLPTEVWAKILSFLPLEFALQLAPTCEIFHAAILSPNFWFVELDSIRHNTFVSTLQVNSIHDVHNEVVNAIIKPSWRVPPSALYLPDGRGMLYINKQFTLYNGFKPRPLKRVSQITSINGALLHITLLSDQEEISDAEIKTCDRVIGGDVEKKSIHKMWNVKSIHGSLESPVGLCLDDNGTATMVWDVKLGATEGDEDTTTSSSSSSSSSSSYGNRKVPNSIHMTKEAPRLRVENFAEKRDKTIDTINQDDGGFCSAFVTPTHLFLLTKEKVYMADAATVFSQLIKVDRENVDPETQSDVWSEMKLPSGVNASDVRSIRTTAEAMVLVTRYGSAYAQGSNVAFMTEQMGFEIKDVLTAGVGIGSWVLIERPGAPITDVVLFSGKPFDVVFLQNGTLEYCSMFNDALQHNKIATSHHLVDVFVSGDGKLVATAIDRTVLQIGVSVAEKRSGGIAIRSSIEQFSYTVGCESVLEGSSNPRSAKRIRMIDQEDLDEELTLQKGTMESLREQLTALVLEKDRNTRTSSSPTPKITESLIVLDTVPGLPSPKTTQRQAKRRQDPRDRLSRGDEDYEEQDDDLLSFKVEQGSDDEKETKVKRKPNPDGPRFRGLGQRSSPGNANSNTGTTSSPGGRFSRTSTGSSGGGRFTTKKKNSPSRFTTKGKDDKKEEGTTTSTSTSTESGTSAEKPKMRRKFTRRSKQ